MSLISMKSQEVLILPIIIWVGSPPFQVKVIILKIENGPLYLVPNQQTMRAATVYWAPICVKYSQHSMILLNCSHLKVKIIQFTSTRNEGS